MAEGPRSSAVSAPESEASSTVPVPCASPGFYVTLIWKLNTLMCSMKAGPIRIAIQTSTPDRKQSATWGDFHFASSLAKELQALGHYARVDCNADARTIGRHREIDVVLTLLGLYDFPVDQRTINLAWVISHPDRLAHAALDRYDYVFVASRSYAGELREQLTTPVQALSQATDTSVFPGPPRPDTPTWPVLFVGNSRKVYRWMVKASVRAKVDLAIYGTLWDNIVPARYIRGINIPNADLGAYYSQAGILLNDHWDTMKEFGFISNRLYDAGACSTFVLTDAVRGLELDFPGSHDVADSEEEFMKKISFYLEHPEERRRRGELAREQVHHSHTFRHRVATLLDCIEELWPLLRLRRTMGQDRFSAAPSGFVGQRGAGR